MKGQQLPLAVQLRDSASFDTFYSGPNSEVVTALRESTSNVFLFGAESSGKTHLLQAAARMVGTPYLPLKLLTESGTEVLDGYADASTLCIDDAHTVTENRDWCVALLRLLDTLRVHKSRYVISAATAPERSSIALPDLRTRLAACAVFGIKPLSDEDRATLLRERAHGRGLEISEEVSRWILTHLPRDAGSLLGALDALDRAALSAKRRLTLPFVQSVLVPQNAQTKSAP